MVAMSLLGGKVHCGANSRYILLRRERSYRTCLLAYQPGGSGLILIVNIVLLRELWVGYEPVSKKFGMAVDESHRPVRRT